jgi:diguanylate cyclase (GGDEF)-like protein
MVWFIFLVAVLNVGLGFALAVYAGRQYRELCVLAVEASVPEVTFPHGSETPSPASPSADSEGEPSAKEQPAAPEARVVEPALQGESASAAPTPEEGKETPERPKNEKDDGDRAAVRETDGTAHGQQSTEQHDPLAQNGAHRDDPHAEDGTKEDGPPEEDGADASAGQATSEKEPPDKLGMGQTDPLCSQHGNSGEGPSPYKGNEADAPRAPAGNGGDAFHAPGEHEADTPTATPNAKEDGAAIQSQASADARAPIEASANRAPSADEKPSDVETPSSIAPEENRQINPGEASVVQFQGKVERYHRELTRLDSAFRACRDNPTASEVQLHVDSLRETNEEYLASREQARQAFQELHPEQASLERVHDGLRAVIARQDAQIEDTDSAIEGLDYEGDLAEGCRQMVQQTGKLLDANHGLRDTLEEASVAVAQHEGRLESIHEVRSNDPLTELSTRAQLEACLAEWWQKDPHRARQLYAAMIDVDQFGRLNERHGQEVGDRVLRVIAQLLTTESRNHLLIARFAGQRFLLLFPDVDIRFATSVVERMRQTIEMARIGYRDEEIRVTVSCAVIEVGHQDTPQELYGRAQATLREAKRYGRNRTFVHEGKYPTPVIPPNFTLEEKSVMI